MRYYNYYEYDILNEKYPSMDDRSLSRFKKAFEGKTIFTVRISIYDDLKRFNDVEALRQHFNNLGITVLDEFHGGEREFNFTVSPIICTDEQVFIISTEDFKMFQLTSEPFEEFGFRSNDINVAFIG